MKNDCSHHTCKKNDYVWFPITSENATDVQKHPWCLKCGTLKNLSEDQPKKLGHWMNLLGQISEELHLTQCQKRLISKELSRCDYLQDTFGAFKSSQEKVFWSIVAKHCKVNNIEKQSLER